MLPTLYSRCMDLKKVGVYAVIDMPLLISTSEAAKPLSYALLLESLQPYMELESARKLKKYVERILSGNYTPEEVASWMKDVVISNIFEILYCLKYVLRVPIVSERIVERLKTAKVNKLAHFMTATGSLILAGAFTPEKVEEQIDLIIAEANTLYSKEGKTIYLEIADKFRRFKPHVVHFAEVMSKRAVTVEEVFFFITSIWSSVTELYDEILDEIISEIAPLRRAVNRFLEEISKRRR